MGVAAGPRWAKMMASSAMLKTFFGPLSTFNIDKMRFQFFGNHVGAAR